MKKYVEVDTMYHCQTCANHVNGSCQPYPSILKTVAKMMKEAGHDIDDMIIQCDNGSRYRPDYRELNIVEGILIPNPFSKKESK